MLCSHLHSMMSATNKHSQLLSSLNITTLFDSVDAFLFDCDGLSLSSCFFFFTPLFCLLKFSSLSSGVIWKGDKLINGVSQTLDMLRSKVLLVLLSSGIRTFWFCFWFWCYSYHSIQGQEAGVCDQQFHEIEKAVCFQISLSWNFSYWGLFRAINTIKFHVVLQKEIVVDVVILFYGFCFVGWDIFLIFCSCHVFESQ